MRAAVSIAKVGGLLAVMLAGALWVDHLQARPDIRAFDPAGMSRLESAMWRSYYEGQWLRLGWQAMQVARTQFGFSWLDSFNLSRHAAVAAWRFRNQGEDPSCLAELRAYYVIVQQAAVKKFDAAEAAALELAWWKERRRSMPPGDYARTIAKLAALVYEVDPPLVLASSTLRAAAMEYRDVRRDRQMGEDDWRVVETLLLEAYASLKTSLASGGAS